MYTIQIPIDRRLTNSSMVRAKTCLRAYGYEHVAGIRPERDGEPLVTGRSFHAGLALMQPGVAVPDVVNQIWDRYADVPVWVTDLDDWYTQAVIVCRLLAGYAWRWGEDGCLTLATEFAFDLPIINPATGSPIRNFTMAGRIDRIIRLPDGRLAIRETKTTGESIEPGGDYQKKLRVDQQISLYLHAAYALGHDVDTIQYDVIHKPGIRPKALIKADKQKLLNTGEYCGEQFPAYKSGKLAIPDRETPELYGARLNQDIAERPDFYYARWEIARLPADLDEFRLELYQMQRAIRQAELTGGWFRNTAACLHPYKCPFFEPCMAGVWPVVDVPPGFVRVDDTHPELKEDQNGSPDKSTTQESAASYDPAERTIPTSDGTSSEGHWPDNGASEWSASPADNQRGGGMGQNDPGGLFALSGDPDGTGGNWVLYPLGR